MRGSDGMRAGGARSLRRCRRVLFAALCAGASLLSAAEVNVDGAGPMRDRDLRSALRRLLDAKARPTLDANAIEDAAVILGSALGEEGFQTPKITIEVTRPGGAKESFVFDPTFATPLPRPLEADRVLFRVERGVRSHIAAVELVGLAAIPPAKARGFFRTESTLLGTERNNAFSRARMNRGVDALLGELRRLGHVEAEVQAAKVREVDGAVTVRVEVHEGPVWRVSDVRVQRDDFSVPVPDTNGWSNQPWTATLEQDIREAFRRAYYAEGYPDVGIHVAPGEVTEAGGEKRAPVIVTIVPGSRVAVGQVRFEGNVVTRESVLRRRVLTAAGEPLNPIALERARYRISRLGVFEAVDLHYEPADGPARDPVFVVREGGRYETNLLFGYGSYEQFRGGVEYRQMNVLGLAHQSRLELVQSMKSTSGEYTYTVPELFGESLDGTAKLFGLQRREIAFVRQEYGVSASLRRPMRQLGGDVTIGYTFQALRNRRSALSTQATDDKQVNVATLDLGLTGDRRDSPLRPRHGYHWSGQLEAADPRLGSQATYQRAELGGAYHTAWGASRWIHLSLTHGIITTFGGTDDLSLPVNKRFFPGGDSSIRGYQRGEAAPRSGDGRFLGAKAYLLGNIELEQALTPAWSIVAFGDALGTAVALRDYPFAERLYSVGLGVRYHTLIGPVRLEYGRNINPRPNDPPGTWHLSIGFPF